MWKVMGRVTGTVKIGRQKIGESVRNLVLMGVFWPRNQLALWMVTQ